MQDAAKGPDVDWAAIRRDYEAAATTRNEVAKQHGLPLAAIEIHARRNKWIRTDSDVTDRRILIFKLLALLERQIDMMETQMTANGMAEAAVLTSMVRGLDKLIVLEKAEASALARETETKEMRDIQRKLEKRINAITKR